MPGVAPRPRRGGRPGWSAFGGPLKKSGKVLVQIPYLTQNHRAGVGRVCGLPQQRGLGWSRLVLDSLSVGQAAR